VLLLGFGVLGVRRNIREASSLGASVALVIVVWSYLYLGITATRTVAPSFLIALANAKLLPRLPRASRSVPHGADRPLARVQG
jgi:hypothetical protein